MREITFNLPLANDGGRFVFPPDALKQIAAMIVDHPVKVGTGPDAPQVGVVTAATVEGDRVRCTARVEDWVTKHPGTVGGPVAVTGGVRLSVVGEQAHIV